MDENDTEYALKFIYADKSKLPEEYKTMATSQTYMWEVCCLYYAKMRNIKSSPDLFQGCKHPYI